jgi:hypothetical protein
MLTIRSIVGEVFEVGSFDPFHTNTPGFYTSRPERRRDWRIQRMPSSYSQAVDPVEIVPSNSKTPRKQNGWGFKFTACVIASARDRLGNCCFARNNFDRKLWQCRRENGVERSVVNGESRSSSSYQGTNSVETDSAGFVRVTSCRVSHKVWSRVTSRHLNETGWRGRTQPPPRE